MENISDDRFRMILGSRVLVTILVVGLAFLGLLAVLATS